MLRVSVGSVPDRRSLMALVPAVAESGNGLATALSWVLAVGTGQ